jgi:alkanesulfonate monooxygenase SsuD/methylene tetrahydromethanopterin reductase-like flavin-dependent oxidoreductase (luciferase family)
VRDISLSVAVFAPDPDAAMRAAIAADRAGIDAFWLPTLPLSFDPLTLMSALADRTDRIAIGPGIVPTYPRHPATLVGQILSVLPFAGERLRVGLGSSHPFIISGMLGLAFESPVAHLREYLSVVRSLLERGRVDLDGRFYRMHAPLAAAPAKVPLPISALRAPMFRLAGEIADGAISAWCPIPYLLQTALPAMERGARAAGRTRPPLVAHVPVIWSSERSETRAAARAALDMPRGVPAYSAVFEASGFPVAADGSFAEGLIDELFVHGSETQIAERLRSILAAGVDELMLTFYPARDAQKESEAAFVALGGLCNDLRRERAARRSDS